MKAQENEIKLLYNGNKQRDKEVKGYAQSLKNHKLNEVDIAETELTERQLAQIADHMGMEIEDIIDTNEEKYMTTIKGGEFSDEQLLKLMVKNPGLIQSPIAYMHGRAFIVKSQYSLVNEDLEIEGVKSDKGNKFEK